MTAPKQKHEWRRHEKELYLPDPTPALIRVPAFRFLRIRGEGDPNKEPFNERIRALYPVAYGIKMTAKKPGRAPEGYRDFTVYPLEGVWDLKDEARPNSSGGINKDDLVYELMIRQPDFVTGEFFAEVLDEVKRRRPDPLLGEIDLVELREGPCVQMLHVGPFDREAESFAKMEAHAADQGLVRESKLHREIYLSDFRRTVPEKLKTILRFRVRAIRREEAGERGRPAVS